jgi:hypothetical protein
LVAGRDLDGPGPVMALAPVLVTAKQRIEAAKAIEVLRMSPTQLYLKQRKRNAKA